MKSLFEEPKSIPIYHEKDTRYKYHCVDCGALLIHFECEFDGHRNEVGELKWQDSQRVKTFGGMRCQACHKKLFEFVEFEYYNKVINES